MIIHSNGRLFGFDGKFHLRKVEGGLRVDGTTISVDDPDGAFEKIKAAAAKGETYVDLDAKPAATRQKKATTAEE